MDKVSKAQHAGKGFDGKPPVPADALEVTPPREAAAHKARHGGGIFDEFDDDGHEEESPLRFWGEAQSQLPSAMMLRLPTPRACDWGRCVGSEASGECVCYV